MPIPSKEQEQFINTYRHRKRKICAGRILLFFGILLVWQLTAQYGLLNDFIFSSPSRMLHTFLSMTKSGAIFSHIGITLAETFVSFFFVTVCGILLALLLWLSPDTAKIFEPLFVVLNALPKSALAPVLIVWLGNNIKTIIVAGISVAVFGSVLTLYTAFNEIDEEYIKLIYTLKGTRRDALFKVILPACVPTLLNNMKVNIGLCLVGVIIGEFLAANEGLGYLIIYGSQVFKMDLVMLSILILCLIAMILYQVLNRLELHFRQN